MPRTRKPYDATFRQ